MSGIERLAWIFALHGNSGWHGFLVDCAYDERKAECYLDGINAAVEREEAEGNK